MALLVLVHGVCAGAWSWDLVTPHLVAAGHETLAVDLPDVAEMVFLCGAIPVPGQSIAERGAEWRAIDDGEWQIDNGDGSFSISHEGFRNHVAPDAPPDVIEWTLPRLKPQFLTPFLEPCPIDRLPDVPIWSIYCAEDRIVDPRLLAPRCTRRAWGGGGRIASFALAHGEPSGGVGAGVDVPRLEGVRPRQAEGEQPITHG